MKLYYIFAFIINFIIRETMKQKVMLLLTCLFLSIGMVMAQSSKVTGRVLSAEDNEPIVGATVQIEGTNTGTVTDLDGKFGTVANIRDLFL